MTFSVGSLVRARGREWVVLPNSEPDLLLLQPLGGTDDEVTGILPEVEPVEPARFSLPDPDDLGDHRSGRLLRDAVRLGFRASAGPFRSFARLAVEPRSYQLVPLLMSLRQDPVRMLIGDDVGIGKTIEALLIARELLDRGEIQRIAVLCPPHLADQWQEEMEEKFHIEAEVVLPGTVRRLERHCRVDESLFDRYPHVVVSTDFIKSDRRRDDFLRACPEFVIVDEAHTCAWGHGPARGRHQRHELVKGLSAKDDRHLVLVTATPHSGKEEAFRSLLSLIKSDLGELPTDLSGPDNAPARRRLAQYFVQRRRDDIRHYLEEDTSFPDRCEEESTWALTDDYRKLFDRVLAWARETVRDPELGGHRQRVRWWSALALLRSLGSSPAAAAATLRTRAASSDTRSLQEADEMGRRAVLDLDDEEGADRMDVAPGVDPGDNGETQLSSQGRRLRELAREAEALEGEEDPKVAAIVPVVEELLEEGFSPILYCRFIPTVDYLTAELRKRLRTDVEVAGITGALPSPEREARVVELSEAPKRILVCTDCLAEGINLQRWFDAVVHYDLSWSPTRHEQREGRVDRFGQNRDQVRVITFYGVDNQIDGIVLDVLLRKHREIRKATGVAVPVPEGTTDVVEAIFEGLLLREQRDGIQTVLPGLEEYLQPKKEDLHGKWDSASNREKRSRRTMFAQERLKPEEVKAELEAAREALGGRADVERFVRNAVPALGGTVTGADPVTLDLREAPRGIQDLAGVRQMRARFEPPVHAGETHLTRTHPFVEGLAAHVLDTGLDPQSNSAARRASVIRTQNVERRTTLLLLRYRFQIHENRRDSDRTLLAEDARVMGFRGSPTSAEWLPDREAELLLAAVPDANIDPEVGRDFVARVVEGWEELLPDLEEAGEERARELLEAHRRVRRAAERTGVRYRVDAERPPDLLGAYIFLPAET